MGILGDVLGGIGGLFGGSGDEDRAKQIWDQLNAEAGPSAFEKVTSDPALRASQMADVQALHSIANHGGLRTQDRVAYDQALTRSNNNEAANRAAILQGLAQRGMAGSGAELAAQLANQQGAATRANQFGSNVAAEADQRALQALSQGAGLAGQVRGQDWNEAASRAGALDNMARFNAGQRVQKAAGQAGQYDAVGQRNSKRWQDFGSSVGDDVADIGIGKGWF